MKIDILKNFDTTNIPDEGYFDERSFCQIIFPKEEWLLNKSKSHLIIGSAGVDGIVFGLTPESPNVFAYYPIEDEWIDLNTKKENFIENWIKGELTV